MVMTSDKIEVKALSQGINLTALRGSIGELEAACNQKIEAAEVFKNAIQVAALSVGLLPGVLSQYITSRCKDSVKKKARSSEQLSLLFSEIQD